MAKTREELLSSPKGFIDNFSGKVNNYKKGIEYNHDYSFYTPKEVKAILGAESKVQQSCSFCHEAKDTDGPTWIGATGERIDGARLYLSISHPGFAVLFNEDQQWQGININYCPVCGRRLSNEQ